MNLFYYILKFYDFENEIVIILMFSDGNKLMFYVLKEKILKLLVEIEIWILIIYILLKYGCYDYL